MNSEKVEDEIQGLVAPYTTQQISNSSLLARFIRRIRPNIPNERAPESISERDDREKVIDSKAPPWRKVCSLKISYKLLITTQEYYGTGFFVDKNMILTAAHNVYRKRFGYPLEVTVIPGHDGRASISQPFKNAKSNKIKCPPEYVANQSRDYDYAAIIIDDGSVGDSVGFFDLEPVISDSELAGSSITSAGYPASPRFDVNYDGKQQFFQKAEVYKGRTRPSDYATRFYHNLDTNTGQSGAPVWINRDGKEVVIGIHTQTRANSSISDSVFINSALRITQDVLDNIELWKR